MTVAAAETSLAEALFQWNRPSDPYFVINGRPGETWEDPYLPIARGVLAAIAAGRIPGVVIGATEVPSGPCWHDPGVTWPDGFAPRCELLAGHAGAHQCDRGNLGGSAVWTEDAGVLEPGDPGTTTDEWSVRCGDGDVLDAWTNREAAAGFINSARKEIADGEWDADDYEPMELVHRTRTTYADQLTEWTAIDLCTRKCSPGHEDPACSAHVTDPGTGAGGDGG